MYQQTPPGKDPQLWQLAQRRASFQSHLSIYAVLSLFFWLLWLFTGSNTSGNGLPWPVWPMFGWGIGIFFHYMSAYATPMANRTEREYEKLINNTKS